jgi:putative membrane protein
MTLRTPFIALSSLILATSMMSAGCGKSNRSVEAARENTDATKNVISDSDRNFVISAEEDNIKERNLARVVLDKSSNRDVRDYAQMLVDDHTKALRELVDLMTQKGISQPNGLADVKHEALGELNKFSGREFDHEFINLMVNDHEKAVAKFSKEQDAAQDAAIKKYAKDVLPVLEKHLTRARELQSQ